MAAAVVNSTSLPSHIVTASLPSTPSRHQADNEENADISINNLPYTPTSSGHDSSGDASRRQSALVSVSASQHRKASSVSTSTPSTPVSKVHLRQLSLQDPQVVKGLKEMLERRKEVLVQQPMCTPPETLPPSPPLTNHEIEAEDDDDGDDEEDGEDAGDDDYVDSEDAGHAQSSTVEEDITEGLHEPDMPSRTIIHGLPVREHPLAEDAPSIDTRADIDLEKGPDSLPEQRIHTQSSASELGVSKPFEVIRSPRRFSTPKPPHSSYYIGPPSAISAYGTPPCGQMGVHHPREIVRIERDYDHGELVQFSAAYPLEFQGRITPTQFLETINALNEGLIRAHSVRAAALYNLLAVLTLWISPFFLKCRYDKEMGRLQQLVDILNGDLYNPQGLNILWPRKSAFLFLEIEYY